MLGNQFRFLIVRLCLCRKNILIPFCRTFADSKLVAPQPGPQRVGAVPQDPQTGDRPAGAESHAMNQQARLQTKQMQLIKLQCTLNQIGYVKMRCRSLCAAQSRHVTILRGLAPRIETVARLR
jgi:hypothetical protein